MKGGGCRGQRPGQAGGEAWRAGSGWRFKAEGVTSGTLLGRPRSVWAESSAGLGPPVRGYSRLCPPRWRADRTGGGAGHRWQTGGQRRPGIRGLLPPGPGQVLGACRPPSLAPIPVPSLPPPPCSNHISGVTAPASTCGSSINLRRR